jgi:hypothetical protein
MEASIFPASIAVRASSRASNPTTRIRPDRPAAAIASTAPSAIRSLHANSASMSACAWSMFWNTVNPWSRSQFAGWLLTIVIPGCFASASRNPRRRESPVS